MNYATTNKITQYLHEKGASKTILWIVAKSLRKLATTFVNPRMCYIIERTLNGNLPEIKGSTEVEFHRLRIEDINRLKDVRTPWSRYKKIFEDRLKRCQSCIVCYCNGKAVGYIWMSDIPETDNHIGLTIRPGEHESYGFDLYVLPEYRKQLIGFELISQWLKRAKESGKRKAIGVVASYNQPMLVTMKLVFGFKKTKIVRSLEFLRWRGFVISEKNIS